MNCYYDFHIHTALSPCADNDMTPNNIVNMAMLKGLDVIAVADHNTIGNAEAVIKAGNKTGILVLPGMEVQTAEEVHVLCLFPSLSAAKHVADIVYNSLPDIENRVDIFGDQLLFDEQDLMIGREKKLLVNSAGIAIDRLFDEVMSVCGAFIPAHIERASYSIVSNLGFLPKELGIATLELSECAPAKLFESYAQYRVISNSDAHCLGDISERAHKIEISHNSASNILKKLCSFL